MEQEVESPEDAAYENFFFRTKITSISCNVSGKTVMNRSKEAAEGQGKSQIKESLHW